MVTNFCTQTLEKSESWLSGRNFSEKNPRLLVDKLARSQQCTLGKKGQQHCKEITGGKPSPLCNIGEATPGLLYPVLGSSVKERYGHTKGSPAKVHKEDKRTEASFIQGVAESWDCLSWKTEDLGGSYQCV